MPLSGGQDDEIIGTYGVGDENHTVAVRLLGQFPRAVWICPEGLEVLCSDEIIENVDRSFGHEGTHLVAPLSNEAVWHDQGVRRVWDGTLPNKVWAVG